MQKLVVDNDGSAPESGTEFSIEVFCDDETFEFLTIADGGNDSVGNIAAGSLCSVFEVFGSGFPEPDVIQGQIPLESPEQFNADRTVTITNVYGEQPVVPAPLPPISVTVTKTVTTSGLGQAPDADTQFGFRLECLGPDFDFSLADGESFTATITANTLCSLTEADSQGAADVSGEFGNTLLTANSSFTVQFTFVAVQPTLPGRTLDSAEARFDIDDPGGDPPQSIGPVDDDVEIIEVLALPPLGDGGSAPPTAGGVLALLGAAAVAALGARRLARRRSGSTADDIAA